MPRNGSGTMVRGYSWVTDAANGLKISSSRMDTDTNDIANELSNSVAADGQTQPTANLPMNTHRHTNVGNAAARTDYAAAGQIQDGGLLTVGSVAGTNTITGNLTPAITAYVALMRFSLIPANTNTGATTVNLNGVGALTAKKVAGASLVALAAGDLVANTPSTWILSDTSTAILLNPANLALLNINQSFTAAQGVNRVALTDAATVAVDASLSNVYTLTLGGNRTLGQPTNPKDGQSITIVITQDGTGSRTLAYHADWLFAGGVDPTLSTAANSVDVLSGFYNGATTKWYASLSKAFA